MAEKTRKEVEESDRAIEKTVRDEVENYPWLKSNSFADWFQRVTGMGEAQGVSEKGKKK